MQWHDNGISVIIILQARSMMLWIFHSARASFSILNIFRPLFTIPFLQLFSLPLETLIENCWNSNRRNYLLLRMCFECALKNCFSIDFSTSHSTPVNIWCDFEMVQDLDEQSSTILDKQQQRQFWEWENSLQKEQCAYLNVWWWCQILTWDYGTYFHFHSLKAYLLGLKSAACKQIGGIPGLWRIIPIHLIQQMIFSHLEFHFVLWAV